MLIDVQHYYLFIGDKIWQWMLTACPLSTVFALNFRKPIVRFYTQPFCTKENLEHLLGEIEKLGADGGAASKRQRSE